ncbi:MAG: methyl-accepting chemotaxis protein, partial [Bdellovibrio sp.]
RSASAAKDISTLIKDSVTQIEKGNSLAGKSGSALSEIVTAVKKVSDLNSEIAAASQEQTAGIQQISKAMNQLDQSSQSNAASAEQIAATSSEISGQTKTNREVTQELQILILGEISSSPAAGNSVTSLNHVKKKKMEEDIIPLTNFRVGKVGTTDEF